MCSAGPEDNLESSPEPLSLSQSEPQAKTLPQPVRLDPLSLEITPNSLCSLTGQFPPFIECCGFPVTHFIWSDSCRTCPTCCFLRGRKPLVFSYISLELSEGPWCGFKALLSDVCYSVASDCHCLGLYEIQTWIFVGFVSSPISFFCKVNGPAPHMTLNFKWRCNNVVKVSLKEHSIVPLNLYCVQLACTLFAAIRHNCHNYVLYVKETSLFATCNWLWSIAFLIFFSYVNVRAVLIR